MESIHEYLVITCLVPGYGESRSDVSDPQLELSLSSVVNFLVARGDGGGRRLHTCDWMCSHTRRNRRMLPAFRRQTILHVLFKIWYLTLLPQHMQFLLKIHLQLGGKFQKLQYILMVLHYKTAILKLLSSTKTCLAVITFSSSG